MVKIYSVGVWNSHRRSFLWQGLALKFTPLEFETLFTVDADLLECWLKFTPLEFETLSRHGHFKAHSELKFTPLEFETHCKSAIQSPLLR